MKISFFGGVGTVTGSKFLVSNEHEQVLIDCGLFQGLKQLRLQNWEKPSFDAKEVKAVLLTHAHLDHCGYLPLLVKQGFRGPIYCTAPTLELAKIILIDSAEIQMEDAVYANKKKFSKHLPAVPLYDTDDVQKTLSLFKAIALNQKATIGNFEFEFKSAGHILGAASIYLSDGKTKVLFSGDLGRYKDPLMFPPDNPKKCDFVIMESTYGDRLHNTLTSMEQLRVYINQVWQNKGVLLIPAFSVGRFQNLIYEIVHLKQSGMIPVEIPVYFNSPMGAEVCALYTQFHGFQKLEEGEFEKYLSQIRFVKTADESKSLNERKGPMIIVAASGMLTGGRVLHHLKAFANDPKNVILLAGFQAAGTRGWTLASGQNQVRIHGQDIEVKAQIVSSDSFSAHADQKELLRWLSAIPEKPQNVFLVHGEPIAADELRKKIEKELGMKVTIPFINSSYQLQK